MTPRLSILIPVWNGENQINLCLDAIAAQTIDPGLIEVIVVDNGSTDGTADVVRRYPFATLLSEPRPGSYRARNTGLDHVRGTYIAFTDADCIPHPDWAEKALAAIEAHPEAGIVAGKVELFRLSDADSTTCAAYDGLFNLNQEYYARAGHCATANWTSPAVLIRELGGFNAELKSSGDFEMSKRISATGRPVVYRDDIIVRHPTRGRAMDLVTKRRRVVGGQYVLRKPSRALGRYAVELAWTGARNLRLVWREGPKDVAMRLRLSGLVTLLTISGLGELLRLMLGGTPRRA
ncbi:glycosyltransferase [Sphingomonas montanisoli]|uniref:glycosyltransferase n=1 Tax=Sphingomonas montanisoli TaxID=2606412 RepID=UPI0015E19CEA|nr:glycosyltransferase family 2 protein [Sphingomonas montanisoli]